ncbi:sensor domain-containing diguanylate cyclase [Desulfoluna sp.]|uniref:sensor domain-containing diguanylate cyclase n=1 Tax=Desulfoluna sp. TaxID=2045199 RepID=UPI00262FEEEA|nr:sensor domain-containing diguanylate cyclase [Desulfoluna sp.]
MLSSPAAENETPETLPPERDGLPHDIHIPWQRMVSLLRTLLEAPVVLIVRADGPETEAVVIDRDKACPWPSNETAALSLAEAFSEKVMATRARLIVKDASKKPEETGHPRLKACLGEPLLHADGRVFGALCALDTAPNPFVHQALLTEFRHAMETHLTLMETRDALVRETALRSDLTEQWTREAITDAVTGLPNPNTFPERFHQEIARHTRADHPLSLILCGLDHFQKYNDTRGQAAGDALLASLAELFTARLRTHDLIWRWSGDQFFLLLPDTPLMGAVEVVEAVRHIVEEKTRDHTPPQVTLSAGATSYTPPETEETCLTRCNTLLNAAKKKGRNCVILG